MSLVSPAASDAQVHLEEFDLAESRERTMSGHDENGEALPYRCMQYVTVCDFDERQTMSHVMTCDDQWRIQSWSQGGFPNIANVSGW